MADPRRDASLTVGRTSTLERGEATDSLMVVANGGTTKVGVGVVGGMGVGFNSVVGVGVGVGVGGGGGGGGEGDDSRNTDGATGTFSGEDRGGNGAWVVGSGGGGDGGVDARVVVVVVVVVVVGARVVGRISGPVAAEIAAVGGGGGGDGVDIWRGGVGGRESGSAAAVVVTTKVRDSNPGGVDKGGDQVTGGDTDATIDGADGKGGAEENSDGTNAERADGRAAVAVADAVDCLGTTAATWDFFAATIGRTIATDGFGCGDGGGGGGGGGTHATTERSCDWPCADGHATPSGHGEPAGERSSPTGEAAPREANDACGSHRSDL
jgi:hypothetical protein